MEDKHSETVIRQADLIVSLKLHGLNVGAFNGVDLILFIHSFIHSGDLYSASPRHYYSESLQAQSWPKKKDLREM